MFLSPTGFFIMYFDLKEYLKFPPSNIADAWKPLQAEGIGRKSVLTIYSVDAGHCYDVNPGDKGKKQLVDAFDELIDSKLNSPDKFILRK